MIIAVFLITVLLAFAVQWYLERRKFYKFADNIPSAKNYGILGHGPHFLGKDDEGSWKGNVEVKCDLRKALNFAQYLPKKVLEKSIYDT